MVGTKHFHQKNVATEETKIIAKYLIVKEILRNTIVSISKTQRRYTRAEEKTYCKTKWGKHNEHTGRKKTQEKKVAK